MLVSSLLAGAVRSATNAGPLGGPSRALCTAFRSAKFEKQPPADKQTVDDLIDGYDLSLSGVVPGDMPEGRAQRRILMGEQRHHARDGKSGRQDINRNGGPKGDYEAFYHMRLPRVAGYMEPRQVASNFLKFNTVVYPPTMTTDDDDDLDAARMPAETCVEISKISIDPKALLLFGMAVQGMSVQPALDKLRLLSERPDGRKIWHKFGHLAPLCLVEALELGVRQMVNEESVEFESDMWIEYVGVLRNGSYTVLRKNPRWTLQHYTRPYSLLRVRLREGKPPAYFHPNELPAERNNWLPSGEILQREVDKLRRQRIYRQI